jgi:hypothetical protein
MLTASMAVGHLLTATEREPPRPPHRHQARLAPGTTRMALSQLAWAHAHETLLWASKGSRSRYTFNYDLINSRDPTAQLSSVWHIPSVPRRESMRSLLLAG